MSKKKKKPHATQSFAQMVSHAQTKALQPYIEQVVAQKIQSSFVHLINHILQELAPIQLRQLAVERLLESKGVLDKNDLASAIATEEDKAFGYQETDDPAQKGDLVRLEVRTIGEEENSPEKLKISQLMVPGKDGNLQTFPALEESLLGKSLGSVFQVTIPAEQCSDDKDLTLEVVVKRLSYKQAIRDSLTQKRRSE